MAKRNKIRCRPWAFAGLLYCGVAAAQTPPDVARILERLDRLEQENRQLTEQVRALQARLDGVADAAPAAPADAAPPTLEQRLAIQEARSDELSQTRVEASQKFPVRLAGMALFNAFLNSRQASGGDYPTVAGPTGPRRGGATVRQTVIGLEYQGPEAVGGGRVHGSVYLDFFAGGNNPTLRIRTASIAVDWKNTGVLVGIEKPIFNPREPDSLAQVGISPMTGSGNLWLWLPQARVEHTLSFARQTGMTARLGILQTREAPPFAGSDFAGAIEGSRPAFEGRFEFFHRLDEDRRFAIAPGFHFSTTHAGGTTVPSQIFSADWFLKPHRRFDVSGAFYTGENVAPLGNGYLQGFMARTDKLIPVHSIGGWNQFTVHAAPRVDLHLFAGGQDDRDTDLSVGRIGRNVQYGGNVFYRLAPNVLVGLEVSQVRTWYVGQLLRINNHYDLALAYYF